MVDLLHSEPSLSVREAAKRVAMGMGGTLSTEAERLRKKYRLWRSQNRLPEGGEEARIRRAAAIIAKTYDVRDARIPPALEALPEAEAEVQRLGIDPQQPDLEKVLQDIQAGLRAVEDYVTDQPDWIAFGSMNRGLSKEEALARFQGAAAAREEGQARVAALRHLRDLRRAAGLPF